MIDDASHFPMAASYREPVLQVPAKPLGSARVRLHAFSQIESKMSATLLIAPSQGERSISESGNSSSNMPEELSAPRGVMGAAFAPETADMTSRAVDKPDWAGIVERIRMGDPLAMTELYAVFARGIRYLLLKSLRAEEVDDKVHDCFVIVTEAILSGELRDPARLMGYIHTVVHRRIARGIEEAIRHRRTTVEFEDSVLSVSDWNNNPEQNLLVRQRAEIARRVFNGLSRRDREVLRRFYLLEQPQHLICLEMGLTYNQFRLLKSRAKARFGKLGQHLAQHR